jgi:osmoprotectant transport system substrate-binding protein
MFTANKGRLALIGAVAVGAVVALSGCATSDPLAGDSTESTAASDTLIVGSQAYYSNEIIAEIYSQALEAGGYTVDRQFQIGQREVYLPEIEAGGIDVFPEYTGSLLQALNADAVGGNSDAVYDELVATLPEGVTALDKAEASDQNSWTVTQEFADTWNLTDIASLANVTDPLIVGGNSELETRPYGPATLTDKYGIAIAGFTPIEDGGGAVTIKALVDGDIQLTNVYTADPNIQTNNLLALADPDGLFFADNVVPIVSSKVDAGAADILNAVSAALTASDLVGLNSESVNDEQSAAVIATAWLTRVGLL